MSDYLVSLTSYRGYNIEYRIVDGQWKAVVKQNDVTVAEFVEEKYGRDAINRAFEWVEKRSN